MKRTVMLAACVVACSADITYPDGGIRVTNILQPDESSFTTVSPVFERRCGTLDCHGQVGRPLRIYSGLGLRLPNDAGDLPGMGATTPDEITDNYYSVVGLEPEEMTRVIAGVDPPTKLLILAKPLGLEAHKGGTQIVVGDPAYNCITSWLATTGVDSAACASAVQ
jgi:hypothetical protein